MFVVTQVTLLVFPFFHGFLLVFQEFLMEFHLPGILFLIGISSSWWTRINDGTKFSLDSHIKRKMDWGVGPKLLFSESSIPKANLLYFFFIEHWNLLIKCFSHMFSISLELCWIFGRYDGSLMVPKENHWMTSSSFCIHFTEWKLYFILLYIVFYKCQGFTFL